MSEEGRPDLNSPLYVRDILNVPIARHLAPREIAAFKAAVYAGSLTEEQVAAGMEQWDMLPQISMGLLERLRSRGVDNAGVLIDAISQLPAEQGAEVGVTSATAHKLDEAVHNAPVEQRGRLSQLAMLANSVYTISLLESVAAVAPKSPYIDSLTSDAVQAAEKVKASGDNQTYEAVMMLLREAHIRTFQDDLSPPNADPAQN